MVSIYFGVTPVVFTSFTKACRAASKEIGLISSADGTIQSGSLYDQGKHSQKKLRGAIWHIGSGCELKPWSQKFCD